MSRNEYFDLRFNQFSFVRMGNLTFYFSLVNNNLHPPALGNDINRHRKIVHIIHMCVSPQEGELHLAWEEDF